MPTPKVRVTCAKCGSKPKAKAAPRAKRPNIGKPQHGHAKKANVKAAKKTARGAALSKAIKSSIKKMDCKCGNKVKIGK